LVHEIGSGHYYGYIWGEDVKKYFSLIKPGRSIASNLHCDTIKELMAVLNGQLGVAEDLIRRVDILLFISVGGSFMNMKRRVSKVYESKDGSHRLVFSHNPKNDNFKCETSDVFSDRVRRMRAFLERLVQKREFEYQAVRKRFIEFYPQLLKP
jgi:type IV secretory pathway ATPase VirB11/archaellum biosynthesis ATPase